MENQDNDNDIDVESELNLNEIDEDIHKKTDTETFQIDSSQLVPEKKKRGRKPKNLLAQMAQQSESQHSEQELQTHNGAVILNAPKKRGRKSDKLISIVDETPMIQNLICHLPLNISDIKKITSQFENINIESKVLDSIVEQTSENKTDTHIIKANNVPKLVDLNDDHKCYKSKTKTFDDECPGCLSYLAQMNKLQEEIDRLKNGIIECSTSFNKKVYESKVNFVGRDGEEWDDKTDIACWWCCHKFDHIPLGIPEFIIKDTFYLTGCFCSFNCMLSYNLDINDYKIWDRQTNIYQLKNRIDPDNKITMHPAPPRQSLDIFGGPLNISAFRQSFYVLNKEFRCFFPPMISIVGIIEEDFRDMGIGSKLRFNRDPSEPIIRRKKPLQKKTNTLNNIVQII
jgi:hypothetical protein